MRRALSEALPNGFIMRHQMQKLAVFTAFTLFAANVAHASDNYEQWPVLTSTFPSTGGGGITIKGYDPVITGSTCVTTFMAVEAGDNPKVYPNFIEFDAIAVQGGILCTNGKWRAFEGGATGTTGFKFFYKDGVFRAGQ